MILLSARFFHKKRHLLACLTNKLSMKYIYNDNYVSTTVARLMAKFDNEFNVDFLICQNTYPLMNLSQLNMLMEL